MIDTITNWHFDGHGINDTFGQRIAKVSIPRELPNVPGLNPLFGRYSELIAKAPEMAITLKMIDKRLDIETQEVGGNYILSAVHRDIKKILDDLK